MKRIKTLTLLIAICLSGNVFAKELDVLGMYVSSGTTTYPGGESVTTITCALVSTSVCYTITTKDPDKCGLNPPTQNGQLPSDADCQYTKLTLGSGDVIEGTFTSHYQHNEYDETGQIVRVHTLTFH
jgi:hypothetical protein